MDIAGYQQPGKIWRDKPEISGRYILKRPLYVRYILEQKYMNKKNLKNFSEKSDGDTLVFDSVSRMSCIS